VRRRKHGAGRGMRDLRSAVTVEPQLPWIQRNQDGKDQVCYILTAVSPLFACFGGAPNYADIFILQETGFTMICCCEM